MNGFKTAMLLAALTALFMALGFTIGGRGGMIIALLVAGVMVWTAWGVARTSLDQLMDRELPEEDRANIVRIAQGHAAVRNVHELKTRQAGISTFMQLHLALDPGMTLAEAHAVSDAVERALQNAYPGAEIIIHQDPLLK